MKAIESRAEVYLMALYSLSKTERREVVAHLLEDVELREDILDLAVIQQRKGESSRPFRDYVSEKK